MILALGLCVLGAVIGFVLIGLDRSAPVLSTQGRSVVFSWPTRP